jgi:hypothetical protein
MNKLTQRWKASPGIRPDDSKEYRIGINNNNKGNYTMKTTRSLRCKTNGLRRAPQGIVFALAILLLYPNAKAETNAVDLASGSGFAILAGAGITFGGSTESSVITGDIGTFPTATITGLENIILNGVNYGGDVNTQNAKDDLVLSYEDAVGRTPDTTYGAIYDLGGSTLASGVYNDPSSFAITGNLTLDAAGDPNAVWIFQAGSTLDTAAGSQVLLINGAQAANVFWQVGTSATLGTDSSFAGSILAMSSITLNDGADVIGRTLARDGSVSLSGNNTVNAIPEPAAMLLLGLGATVLLAARRCFPCRKIFGSTGT